ncbi:MAG: dTMP kinase [Stutzerimonas stutzeri]|nr:MAG: dTMP kinase [Stutzerimonas stutzeri]
MSSLLTFEGIDCAGKGCQVRMLTDRLRSAGRTVMTTREPGGTANAEKIREGLLSGAFKDYGPIAEVMLFNAARTHHLNEAIRPALARGDIVICDRFYDSTVAYQGAGDLVDVEWIKRIQRAVVGDTHPDRTFIIDVPVEVSISRLKLRGGAPDRFEGAARDFHERLRHAYLDIARAEPGRCRVIDGTRSINEVHEMILAELPAAAGI